MSYMSGLSGGLRLDVNIRWHPRVWHPRVEDVPGSRCVGFIYADTMLILEDFVVRGRTSLGEVII